MQRDTQLVEVAARNWLTSQLLRAGVEVAKPDRDRGIDLIAYIDVDEGEFMACPIQMKASSESAFSIDPKYERFPRLLLVHVWYLDDPSKTTAYAMTYAEALRIAEAKGWTQTESWKREASSGRRGYTVTRVSEGSEVHTLLSPTR